MTIGGETLRDITGQRFGRLTALCPTEGRVKRKGVVWKCRCDCGNIRYAPSTYLVGGQVKSCGCLRTESSKTSILKAEAATMVDRTNIGLIKSTKKRSDNSSGVTGVFWNKRLFKWSVKINFQKKYHFLGNFKDFDNAVKARKEAEIKYFGEYLDARKNSI